MTCKHCQWLQQFAGQKRCEQCANDTLNRIESLLGTWERDGEIPVNDTIAAAWVASNKFFANELRHAIQCPINHLAEAHV